MFSSAVSYRSIQRSFICLLLAWRGTTGLIADATVVESPLIHRLEAELRSHHPALQSLSRLAQAERLNAEATRTWADPSLQFGGAVYRYSSMSPEYGDLVYGVQQRLPILGKERAARSFAHTVADAASTRIEARLAELRRDLTKSLLVAAVRWSILQAIADDIRWLETRAVTAESRVASGAESPAMTLRLQNELDRRRLDWTNQLALHESALVAVRRLVGRTSPLPDEPFTLPPVGETIPFSPVLIQQAERAEPEIRRRDAESAVARSAIEVTRRSSRPDVSVGVQAWHEAATGNPAQGMFSLNVSLPWINRAHYQRDLQRDRLRLQSAEAGATEARQDVRRDLEQMVSRSGAARREALLHRDTLLPRTRQMESSLIALWSAGRGDLRDLLDTRRQRIESEIALATATAEYWSELADLRLLCGLKDQETLQSLLSINSNSTPVSR